MYHQFNIQQPYTVTTLYLYILNLSKKKQSLLPLLQKPIEFCNPDEKCLLRGTFRVFKYITQWSLYIPPVINWTILRSRHTPNLRVYCRSENKQRLLHCTAFSASFIFNIFLPSGQYMYRHFNIQLFYDLAPHCIYVFFCEPENKQRLFPYTALTDLFI